MPRPTPMRRWIVPTVILAACAAGDEPDRGRERAPCRPDATCDVGLECWSELCVRPPSADCGPVARRLAGYRVGNYATPEQIAPVVAELTQACTAARLTAREGRCLIDAPDEATLLECPRRLLPELDDKWRAKHAPPPPRDAAVDPTLPVDPWAPPGQTSGACDRYVALLEAFARCPALPAPTRATMRQSITALRQSWRTLPANARPTVEAACAQGAAALPQALASLNCTP